MLANGQLHQQRTAGGGIGKGSPSSPGKKCFFSNALPLEYAILAIIIYTGQPKTTQIH